MNKLSVLLLLLFPSFVISCSDVECRKEADGFVWYKVNKNGWVGALDADKNMIIPAEFAALQYGEGSGTFIVSDSHDRDSYKQVFSRTGRIIIPFSRGYQNVTVDPEFPKAFYVVRKNHLQGICDSDGTEMIEPKYLEISSWWKGSWINDDENRLFSEYDCFWVRGEDGSGICSIDGMEVVPAKYRHIHVIEEDGHVLDEPIIKVETRDEEIGYYDFDGDMIIQPGKYENVSLGHKDDKNEIFFIVTRNGKEGVCDSKGREVISTMYENIIYDDGNFTYWNCQQNGRAVIRPSGNGTYAQPVYIPFLNDGYGNYGDGGISNGSSTNSGSGSNSYETSCSWCHGSRKCQTCGGTHVYHTDFTDTPVACPNCTDGTCPHCKGTGREQRNL